MFQPSLGSKIWPIYFWRRFRRFYRHPNFVSSDLNLFAPEAGPWNKSQIGPYKIHNWPPASVFLWRYIYPDISYLCCWLISPKHPFLFKSHEPFPILSHKLYLLLSPFQFREICNSHVEALGMICSLTKLLYQFLTSFYLPSVTPLFLLSVHLTPPTLYSRPRLYLSSYSKRTHKFITKSTRN